MGQALPIIDVYQDCKWKILKEGIDPTNGGKTLIVQGRFQMADQKNANERVYPFRLLKRECAKLQEGIRRRSLLGELDHPQELETSLKNVSHVITRLEMRGKECVGVLEVLNTPNGKIARELYESKVALGVSSRGAGRAIQRESYFEIADDYNLKTFDIVSDPSCAGAYLGELKESQIILPKDVKNSKNESLKKLYEQIVGGV